MVRVPPGFHRQAVRGGNKLSWRPGLRGSGMQRTQPVPVQAYTGRVSQVPLTGGQVQAAVPASGNLTLSVGPQGLGNVWYPVQITLSTTTGQFDVAQALVYLGAQGVPITLVGSTPTGNGTIALAIPDMTPGQVLIIAWTGAHPGDVAAANVIGTMDALTTS